MLLLYIRIRCDVRTRIRWMLNDVVQLIHSYSVVRSCINDLEYYLLFSFRNYISAAAAAAVRQRELKKQCVNTARKQRKEPHIWDSTTHWLESVELLFWLFISLSHSLPLPLPPSQTLLPEQLDRLYYMTQTREAESVFLLFLLSLNWNREIERIRLARASTISTWTTTTTDPTNKKPYDRANLNFSMEKYW